MLLSANTYGEKNINNQNNSDMSSGLQIASKSQTQRLNSNLMASANNQQQYTSVSSTNKNSISAIGNSTIVEKQHANNTITSGSGYGNFVINTIQNDNNKRPTDLLNIDTNIANEQQQQDSNNTTNKSK